MKFRFKVELLNEFMDRNGMTEEEFCRACGILMEDLEMIYNNVNAVELPVFVNICNATGFSLEQLVER